MTRPINRSHRSPSSLLVGIDLGTTALKICAVDARTHRVVAAQSQTLPLDELPCCGREQDASFIQNRIERLMSRLCAALGATWGRVAGIGVAAQGGSSIIARRSSGEPLTPMILWNDGRTHAYSRRLRDEFPRSFWRTFSRNNTVPAGLGRLLWLKETQPTLFDSSNIHVGVAELVFFQLTGQWRQDAGNAIQIGSYSAARGRLDARAFKRVDVPLSFVAPLRRDHETTPLSTEAARRLRLPSGIPVAGPYMDQEAGYLGISGASACPLQCSLGTAWVGNFVLPEGTVGYSPYQLSLEPLTKGGRLVVQPLLTGNTAWHWTLRSLVHANAAKALSEARHIFESALLPHPGLVALPWVAQPNAHAPEALGSGTFFGISPATTRADLVRAVASGMCFEALRTLRVLRDEKIIDTLVLTGGAGKAAHFRDLMAALFAPIQVLQSTDEDFATARGSLYAFDPSLAQTRIMSVKTPNDGIVAKVCAAHEHYLSIFDMLLSQVPEGEPFRLVEKRTLL